MGRWRIHNRKLAQHKSRGARKWIDFEAEMEARPVLGGLGNVDFHSGALPDGTPFQAMSLRLYDPARRVWRIWWASAASPGCLDPPVEGRFSRGRGQFFGSDTFNGEPVRLRFEWSEIKARSARWEQAFSYDGGRTWDPPNWVMELTRMERPISHLAEARRRAQIMAQEVKRIARTLPRTYERTVREQVKFKVGSIVYVALSRDETSMGFAFPKEERAALVRSAPEKFFLPIPSDMRYNWVHVWLDSVEPAELHELVTAAWAMVVPRKVASSLRT